MAIPDVLKTLQTRLSTVDDPEYPIDMIPRLSVTDMGSSVGIEFFGSPFDEPYQEVLNTLGQPDIAGLLRFLILRAPDEGANGTKHWDLESLLANNAVFQQLETLSVQLSNPSDHNCGIIGADYEENGVLSRILKQSPRLRELTAPSAPNADFFKVGERPLRFLNIDAGFDTQGFIANLSASNSLPELSCLEWGEYCQTYMDDWRHGCTPFKDYLKLFNSAVFANVRKFVWRNPVCSPDEIQQLRRLRPDCSLQIVRSSAAYERS